MKNLFKKLFIPSGEKQEIIAYKSWIVRWNRVDHSSQSYASKQPEVEIFPSEQDARMFARQLKEAVILLNSEVKVFDIKVEENQSKLATV